MFFGGFFQVGVWAVDLLNLVVPYDEHFQGPQTFRADKLVEAVVAKLAMFQIQPF